jgi:hypothetical protein
MTEYEKDIKALIPLACKEAQERSWGMKNVLRPGKDGDFKWDFWTEYYHEAMNRLAAEHGVRRL